MEKIGGKQCCSITARKLHFPGGGQLSLIAALALAFAAPQAAEAAINWKGKSSGSFGTSDNWSGTTGRTYFFQDQLTGIKSDIIYLNKNYTDGENGFKWPSGGKEYHHGLCFGANPDSGPWRFHGQNQYTFENYHGSENDTGWLNIGYETSSSFVRIYAITLNVNNLAVGSIKSGYETSVSGYLITDDLDNNGAQYYGPVNLTAKSAQIRNGSWYATNTMFTCSGIAQLGANAGSTAVVEKSGGNWTAKRLYLGTAPGSTANFYHRSGSLTTSEYIVLGRSESSGSTQSYLEISGGAVTNTTANLEICGRDASGESFARVRICGGEYYSGGNIQLGAAGSADLVIDSGLATANGNVIIANTADCSAGKSVSVNLNGGVLAAKSVTYGSGAAAATFNFNGGTLRARAGGTLIVTNDNLSVKVGANGGTVDANGNAVIIASGLASGVEGGTDGGMKFVGGGMVTLSGEASYSGATTVALGTELVVSNSSAVDSILAGGLKVSFDGSTSGGQYVVLMRADEGTFTEDALANCAVAAGLDASAVTFLLSQDGKSIIADYGKKFRWGDGNSAENWTAAGKWLDADSNAATWEDGCVATFSADGDSVTADSAVTMIGMKFDADATIGGSATVTTPYIKVAAGKDAVITAPLAGSPTADIPAGATLTLGAVNAVNPLSTAGYGMSISGVLDLGGGTQAVGAPNDAFLDGGEIRNGTFTHNGSSIDLSGRTFTIGGGASFSMPNRVYLSTSTTPSHLVVKGVFTGTVTGDGNYCAIGGSDGGGMGYGWIEVLGGAFTHSGAYVLVGNGTGSQTDGYFTGTNATVTLGGQKLVLGNNKSSASTVAFTNSTIDCYYVDFGQGTGRTLGKQTLELVDTTLVMESFRAYTVHPDSIVTFDGATLVPKDPSDSFFPALGSVVPTVGAGGLVISNDVDIAVASPLSAASAARLTKKGTGTLTLSGALTDISLAVEAGGLVLASAPTSTGGTPLTLTAADGTTVRATFVDNAFTTEGLALELDPQTSGNVTIEIGGTPVAGTTYTLFASGLTAEQLSRLTIASNYSLTFDGGAVKVQLNPVCHTWDAGGEDKNWSTVENWHTDAAINAYDGVRFAASDLLASDLTVFDTAASTGFTNICVDSGAWTTDVSQASFTGKPIQVASGAKFALTGASSVTNPFGTSRNAGALSGTLDLGGARQTIDTTTGGGGWIRNGGEIRNGTVTMNFDDSVSMSGIKFTIGKDAVVTAGDRLYLSNGANLVIDGGTWKSTKSNIQAIGNRGGANGMATVEVKNGGTLDIDAKDGIQLGRGMSDSTAGNGQLIGVDATVNFHGRAFYMSYQNGSKSHLALTNSTFTCGNFQFGESSGKSVGAQTVEFVDTTVTLNKFVKTKVNNSSSLTFNGATLVPKADGAFLPDLAIAVTIAEGGLTVNNAYDITIAESFAGTGAFVKRGANALTLSADQAFTGAMVVSNGTLVAQGKSFGGGLVAVPETDATVTLDIAGATFAGDVEIGSGVKFAELENVDWSSVENGRIVVVKSSSGTMTFPTEKDNTGHYFFVRRTAAGNELCYGKSKGMILLIR